MAIFQFFKMAAAAILDFENFKFLTVGAVQRVKLHHRAKFHQNRSKRGLDMVILRFFKMAAAAILDFGIFKTVGVVKRVEMHHHKKFRQNRSNCNRDMVIFRFFQDGGRRHLGFFEILNF